MSTSRKAGQRAGLSREAVLNAAREIAEREGVERLTMRRLAAALGVMPNALYSHVADKDALLDALLDSLLGQIEAEDALALPWREGLTLLMDRSRRLLLDHPRLISVFIARPGLGPNAVRLGEASLALLAKGGIEGARAVEALRILLVYSLGFAAFQAPRTGDEARSGRAEAVFGALPDGEYPQMRRLARGLSQHPDEDNFLMGLAWLLDGIERSSRDNPGG